VSIQEQHTILDEDLIPILIIEVEYSKLQNNIPNVRLNLVDMTEGGEVIRLNSKEAYEAIVKPKLEN